MPLRMLLIEINVVPWCSLLTFAAETKKNWIRIHAQQKHTPDRGAVITGTGQWRLLTHATKEMKHVSLVFGNVTFLFEIHQTRYALYCKCSCSRLVLKHDNPTRLLAAELRTNRPVGSAGVKEPVQRWKNIVVRKLQRVFHCNAFRC